jgi:hypothetical protein
VSRVSRPLLWGNMDSLAKFRNTVLLLMVAASPGLIAQTIGPVQPQKQAVKLDAQKIMVLSVAATERSWDARDHYTYMVKDEDRRLDAQGHVKSQEVNVTKMIMVNGGHFDQLMEHDGKAPSAEDQRKRNEAIEKQRKETPAERYARTAKDRDNRAFLHDVIEAFDLHIAGEEVVGGRAAYVLEVTARPGYSAHGKYGKFLSKVGGTLWIDKQDYGWIKLDGEVTQAFLMGLFVARVQRGSHIVMEQMPVGDGVWVPKRVEVRASARIFFVKSFEMDRIFTYSEYLTSVDTSDTANSANK